VPVYPNLFGVEEDRSCWPCDGRGLIFSPRFLLGVRRLHDQAIALECKASRSPPRIIFGVELNRRVAMATLHRRYRRKVKGRRMT